MPGDQCIMCGSNTRHKDRSVSLHRIPRKEPKRGRWLEALDLVEDLKDFHRVCSKHFPDGDTTKDPQLNLGKQFASPKKRWTSRAKRAQKGPDFSAKDQIARAAVQSLQCLKRKVAVKHPRHWLLQLWLPELGSNWILVSKVMSYPLMTAFLYVVHLLLQ